MRARHFFLLLLAAACGGGGGSVPVQFAGTYDGRLTGTYFFSFPQTATQAVNEASAVIVDDTSVTLNPFACRVPARFQADRLELVAQKCTGADATVFTIAQGSGSFSGRSMFATVGGSFSRTAPDPVMGTFQLSFTGTAR